MVMPSPAATMAAPDMVSLLVNWIFGRMPCAEVDGVVGLAGVCGAALILLSIFIPQLWEKCRQNKTTLQGEWL
jgi:hypothetical protein